ncbi:Peptidyl-prolyl cis-trans isomerase FKBP16-1, chloroplastic [Sesamum alatum]|uniref:peptidylprolyl isomerase n=1 Tax=Sesamum alatum TaxID=300844 RepID=A0AAE2CYY9_9LAMI|nr:Peptidyl-prolyl cis-trans isomerase FKBP16-1, chloroplastic [Sesamum alatum]
MEAPAFQVRLQLTPLLSAFTRIRKTEELKVSAQRNLKDGYPSIVAKKEMKEPDVLRTVKLASGVRIQDVVEGQGQEAREGDIVEFNYVCRRSNGYFVHSTVDQFSGESSPVILPLDDEQIIKGLKEVLVGMKVGGKRRALIPPSVGYTSDTLQPVPEEFGPRRSLLSHAKEPLVFEVQLLKVL